MSGIFHILTQKINILHTSRRFGMFYSDRMCFFEKRRNMTTIKEPQTFNSMACEVKRMSENRTNKHILTCQCPYCQAVRASLYPIDFYVYPTPENQVKENLFEKEVRQEVIPGIPILNVNTQTPIQVNNQDVFLPKTIMNPTYEFRGVWVTTVRNNDFPSRAVFENGKFNLERFKQEYLDIIYRCLALNLNAIIFQVRPEGDAFYPSELNPWSAFLTGRQGVKPDWGNFDPLAWMIQVAHQEGIEFHAWFNPYRLTPTGSPSQTKEDLLNELVPNHYARQNPQNVYYFNRQLYLNPGVPEVTDFIVETVMEVVRNYDIDAVHFDDYFYPYSYETIESGQPVMISFAQVSPDYDTYETYHQPDQTIDEWREQNINELVRRVSVAIHDYDAKQNKSIAFGISPFGVWASAEETGGVGSNTSSAQLSSLSEYVNTKLWIDNEWIDYVVPQNYWSFSDPLSPFGEVSYWWNQTVANSKTQLYMGLGIYLYDEDRNNPAWQNADEIVNQIRYLRTLNHVDGYVFFTYHNLVRQENITSEAQEILNAAILRLHNTVLSTKSLIPPRYWLQFSETYPVSNLNVVRCEQANCLVFNDSIENNSQYYVIYRVAGYQSMIDFSDPSTILAVVGKAKGETVQHYTDEEINENQVYTYAVTALSQAQVQSKASQFVFQP